MKRTLEEKIVPSNPFSREVNFLFPVDVWVHIMPLLPASSLLALQLTNSDCKFLVDYVVSTYSKEEKKKNPIPLTRKIDLPKIINNVLQYGNVTFFEWIEDLAYGKKHHIRNNFFLGYFLTITKYARLDFVEYFKDIIIEEFGTKSPVEGHDWVVNREEFWWNRLTGGTAPFIVNWSEFICWLVMHVEISLLLELMDKMQIILDRIIVYGPSYNFASVQLFALILARNDERLLEIYLDPSNKYKSPDTIYPYTHPDADDASGVGWKSSETGCATIWTSLKIFGDQKIYAWCDKSLPRSPNVYHIESFDSIAEEANFHPNSGLKVCVNINKISELLCYIQDNYDNKKYQINLI
jgi:hypothetical protein